VSLDVAGDRVAIGVADEGPGIPDTEQRDVFRKFVRGSAARARNVKGTGIGLAMVQEIVRAHGGRVDLVSEPGRGSRFSVVLPARPGTIPVADGLGRQTL
jgi:two-component system phosphate regulon sensor histidine kinase PhoR